MAKRKASVPAPSNREARKTRKEPEVAKDEVEEKLGVKYVAKALCPRLPPKGDRRDRLLRNLRVMRCESLMDIPWTYTSDEMVEEVATGRPPRQFTGTLRADPSQWTEREIGATFHLDTGGAGLLARAYNANYQDWFKCKPCNTEGWGYRDAKEEELQDILMLLVPLIRPNKPTRVTISVAATIIDCLYRKHHTLWVELLRETISKEVKNLEGGKTASYLPGYVVYMY
jgi:hypothetical protein